MIERKETKKIIPVPAKKIQEGRGLDLGTAFIHCAQKTGSQVTFKTQRNAFFDIEYSDFVQGILEKGGVKYILDKNRIYVVGDDSIKFANVFSKTTRRPLRSGVINPKEAEALRVLELIVKSALGSPLKKNETVYYSVPGAPVDADFDTIYHQNIIKGFLEKWGYIPKPINEALAVIFSELGEDNFTGLGISMGGGMINVCLALMSVPVFSFSIAKAGDWIDEQVAMVANEPISKITLLKETSLDLRKSESNLTKIEQALSIYYNNLIEYILEQIKKEISKNGEIPEFEKSIPIIISGGTANPPGFIGRFKDRLERVNFPLKIKEVRLAPNPLYTVAKGALIVAIADKKES